VVLADTEIERALVVVAHPDDADFWAGGTVAGWTTAGQECPWLTVANRRRRARNGTEMARPVRTTAAPAWRRRCPLGRWVRLVVGDHEPHGKHPQGARQLSLRDEVVSPLA
jgi:hypothetical protein